MICTFAHQPCSSTTVLAATISPFSVVKTWDKVVNFYRSDRERERKQPTTTTTPVYKIKEQAITTSCEVKIVYHNVSIQIMVLWLCMYGNAWCYACYTT
jgi:hypothetical protein